MIRGIIALFTSGLIFAPQVLLGIILGIVFGIKFEFAQIKQIYQTPLFYLTVFVFVAIYVYFFKLTYKNSRRDIDWGDNLLRIFGYCLMFFTANILTLSFMYSFFM